jgi:cytochrome P450
MAIRLLTIIFTAIHTSTLTGSGTLLDLAASAPEKKYLEGLREECSKILAESDGVWTKDGLARMYRVDSAIRESQRINGLSTVGVTRRVAVPDGIQLPNGSYAARGTLLTVGAWSVQNDNDLYDDPSVYDPLRYSTLREELIEHEEARSAVQEKMEASDVLKHKNLSMIATSDRHLVFGYGKHAWYV